MAVKRRPARPGRASRARRRRRGAAGSSLPRRGAGRRQDLRDAARRAPRAGARASTSSSGVVETHGRAETEALLAGLEVLPRQRDRPIAAGTLPEIRPRRGCSRASRELALVDELAHTNVAGPPPSQTLAGRRGTARRRHRRLHHAQRPAPRKPERRRRADHRRARARDRARPGARARRRDRADRPAARRTDRAAERRARSMCRRRSPRAIQNFFPRAT